MKLDINKNYCKLVTSISKKGCTTNHYQPKILPGSKISTQLKNPLIIKTNYLIKEYTKKPSLVIVKVGDDFASSNYINYIVKSAKEVGIKAIVKKIETTNTAQLPN